MYVLILVSTDTEMKNRLGINQRRDGTWYLPLLMFLSLHVCAIMQLDSVCSQLTWIESDFIPLRKRVSVQRFCSPSVEIPTVSDRPEHNAG